jgi:hypothetical protein
MHTLIDSDSILFRAGFAVQSKKHKFFIKGEEHFGPFAVYDSKKDIPKEYLTDSEISYTVEESIEPLENCLYLVKRTLTSIIENTNADSYKVYLKGKGNFREQISKTRVYKGNRDVTHRPKYEPEIRDYLITKWKAEVVDGMECDDKVCMEQCKNLAYGSPIYTNLGGIEKIYGNYKLIDCLSIIASIDKDLDQVPGWHYNFATKEKYWITEEQAILNFYTQLLVGDASDNIEGIPGVGEKTAIKILEGCPLTDEALYERCLQAYQEHLGKDIGEARLIEMASLIYLLRFEDDRWKPPI